MIRRYYFEVVVQGSLVSTDQIGDTPRATIGDDVLKSGGRPLFALMAKSAMVRNMDVEKPTHLQLALGGDHKVLFDHDVES